MHAGGRLHKRRVHIFKIVYVMLHKIKEIFKRDENNLWEKYHKLNGSYVIPRLYRAICILICLMIGAMSQNTRIFLLK